MAQPNKIRLPEIELVGGVDSKWEPPLIIGMISHTSKSYAGGKDRVCSILSKSDRTDAPGLVFDVLLYSSVMVVLMLTWMNTLSFIHGNELFLRWYIPLINSCTAFFLIEYALRIWSCTSNEAFSSPFQGRIRFALSPLQLVDAMAIGSVLLLGVDANLLFLRTIRLFKVSEYMGEQGIYSPLQILKRSVLSKKEELIITVFLSGTIIIICAYAMFYIEKDAQPHQMSSLTPSLAWAFDVLTGAAPSGIDPVTGIGQALFVAMRIMGVVIVGLPVGIITGGFVEEITEAKAVRESKKKAAVIHSAFKTEDKITVRSQIKKAGMRARRRLINTDVAMARLQFSPEEIFKAVAVDDGLRIRACKQSADSIYEDSLVIEEFPANSSFGCFIKRDSRIHVVCTQSVSDAGIGHFSRTVAENLGASYYSNEYFSTGELLEERQFNFANNPLYRQAEADPSRPAFTEWKQALLLNIMGGDLVIYIGTTSATRTASLQVLFGGKKGDMIEQVENPTIDLPRAIEFYESISRELGQMDMQVITHEEFNNNNPEHVSQFMRFHCGADVISLFVNLNVVQFMAPVMYYRYLKAMLDSLTRLLAIDKTA